MILSRERGIVSEYSEKENQIEKKRWSPGILTQEIQPTIMLALSAVSMTALLILGVMMVVIYTRTNRQNIVQSTQSLAEQVGENMEDYLSSMRRVSDTIYFNEIKETDFADTDQMLQSKMNILYESNKEYLKSIAVYNDYGSLLVAEPVAQQKSNINVSKQEWFVTAKEEIENLHFSLPHMQNLFDDGLKQYDQVITLSRAIEITSDSNSVTGVLLVDMDYSMISRMMRHINDKGGGQYYYLCDKSGEIIYHPRQTQLQKGLGTENSAYEASLRDGVYDETYEGEKRKVVVTTISYTGWRLISVIPYSVLDGTVQNIGYVFALIIVILAMMLVVVNRLVARKVTDPLVRLNASVLEYEAGEKPEIYSGGSSEIRHLGSTIQKSYEQIDVLMRQIVEEQTERRKSELDALQSQINPHFLYNTLDSITWMIEGERNDEAAQMITQLARLFRISLAKGRTVISVREELQHAESYMALQSIRYKNAFSVFFDVQPEIYDFCTVKLILQPILENAINYGMNGMDDSGEIRVSGERRGEDILLSVQDNGMGMKPETAKMLLTDAGRTHALGSGVGLMNVNNRIQILFGKEYGLLIESEPDEGTKVTVRLPIIPYNEENRMKIERGERIYEEE